jgi:hypothetical protein
VAEKATSALDDKGDSAAAGAMIYDLGIEVVGVVVLVPQSSGGVPVHGEEVRK